MMSITCSRYLVEVEDGGVRAAVVCRGGCEIEAAGERQHGYVFGEDVGDDGVDFFGAGDLDEASDEFAAEAGALVAVGDEDAEFGFFAAEGAGEAADGEDFVGAGLGIDAVDDEGDFAVVIDAAAADEVGVGDARVEFLDLEITEVDGGVGEGEVEVDHEGFVFRADGTDGDFAGIFHLPARNVLRGVRADGGARELSVLDVSGEKDHAGVEGEELFGGGEDGVDIDFAETGLLHN